MLQYRVLNITSIESAAAKIARGPEKRKFPAGIPMKRRGKLCVDSVESVDLTLDTDEPVSPLARMKKIGNIVLNKENIALPNVIVQIDNKLTEMRIFRNAQTRHPGFFETVDFVYKLEFESVVCLKPNTWLSDRAIFEWLKRQWKFMQRR